MKQVYIKGKLKPVLVSDENANEIENLKNNPMFVGLIKVGNSMEQKEKIGKIVGSTGQVEYNKSEILEFEKMLKGLENQETDNIDYYGYPLKDGIVSNEILGNWHWTIIKYALDNDLIVYKQSDTGYWYWAIVDKGIKPERDISEFIEFKRKLTALEDIKDKRHYAQKKQAEFYGK
jgi:hypothetical protein